MISPPHPINPTPVGGSLVAIISELTGVPAAELGPDFSLGHPKLASSLGRAKLDARLRRRLAVSLNSLGTLRTLVELERAVLVAQGQSAPAARNQDVGAPASDLPKITATASDKRAFEVQPPLACGVDLERVSDLPECRDYWEEPFYQEHFTPSEIGYCLAQPSPRMHFAARWCMKEAVRKCGGDFARIEFRHLEVVHTETGAPMVRLWRGGVLVDSTLAVSLSHTDEWVVAMAVRAPASAAPGAVPRLHGGGDWTAAVALLVSLAALALAVLSLAQR